jgi:hypothetical protein
VLQTEFPFTLPFGYIDEGGTLHRDGVMRLATARDEIEALGHPRVRTNTAYMCILLLSRVVTRLGSISPVSSETIEGLFSADFVFLQDLFVRVNDVPESTVETECPNCAARFMIDLVPAAHE